MASLAYVTTNGAMRAFDAEANRQRVEARERDAQTLDTAMRRGLASVVAGMQQPAASPPATVAPAAAPTPAQTRTASGGVDDPTDDDDAAVRTLLGEAAGQGEAGLAGVAHVIRNRARQSGLSPREVVLAPGQFEPWQTRRAELMRYDRNSPQYQEALRIWRGTADGSIADPTGGADHFLNPAVVRQRTGGRLPAWAQGQGVPIGAHTFYSVGYRGPRGTVSAQPAAAASAAPAAAPQQPAQNPLAPAIAQLLRVPGGGRAALQMLQAGEQMQGRRETADLRRQQLAQRTARQNQAATLDLRERQGAERNMMIALGRGYVELARTFADRAGISLPEQVWQDRANHSRFSTGALLARRYYSDRDQAATFVREYMRDGNAMRAAEAAGPPRGREQGWRPIWVQEGERQVLQLLNPGTQEVRPVLGADGQPTTVMRAGGAGGGRPTVWQQRREALMRIFDGDEPMVDRLMTGIAPTPRQIAQAYQRALATAANDPAIMSDANAQRRRAEATMDSLFPNWREIRDRQQPPPAQPLAPVEGGGEEVVPPAAPAAPAPAAPAAATPPREYRLRDGTVGVLTSDRTRDGRPIYRTPDGRRFAPPPAAAPRA